MRLRLGGLFSDRMVLQRNRRVPVWGWALNGDKIRLEFNGQKKEAIANFADSEYEGMAKWRILLDPMKAETLGLDMKIKNISSGDEAVVRNILAGDVWLCSGQSNMEWTLGNCKNAEEELKNAQYPGIRSSKIHHMTELSPKNDLAPLTWIKSSPANAQDFSGVGYFFARELHVKTGVPIGLLNSSWGGTNIESWTSLEASLSDPTGRRRIAEYEEELQGAKAGTPAYDKKMEWENKYSFKNIKNIGEENGWNKSDFSDSSWKIIEIPQSWQNAGYRHSGVFWFRKEIQVPRSWKGKELTISLGPTDKSDKTYFNGKLVGSLSMEERGDAWCTPRIYTIPSNLVKVGRNVVSVRVFSNIFEGGFIGRQNQMKLAPLGSELAEAIPLHGEWKFEIEANFGLVPPPPPPPRGAGNPNSPHILFDNMIRPLIEFPLRGAIWYQGESDAWQAKRYRYLFKLLIQDWRRQWKSPNMPFYFVQLANYGPKRGYPEENNWAELREAQSMALQLPKTGMALAIDIGEELDIHPRNKQDVGLRLALHALKNEYGFKDLVCSGPTYLKKKLEGAKIRIYFKNTHGGLIAKGECLNGFSIAGKDGKFVWANATIDGDTVLLHSEKIAKPLEVRYAWTGNPDANLFNGSNLPASPFRTDKFPAISK